MTNVIFVPKPEESEHDSLLSLVEEFVNTFEPLEHDALYVLVDERHKSQCADSSKYCGCPS